MKLLFQVVHFRVTAPKFSKCRAVKDNNPAKSDNSKYFRIKLTEVQIALRTRTATEDTSCPMMIITRNTSRDMSGTKQSHMKDYTRNQSTTESYKISLGNGFCTEIAISNQLVRILIFQGI